METSCTLTPTTLTVAQKETLQKFIEMLPKLFEHEEIISLYGSKINLWNVSLTEESNKRDVILLKFLKAREFDLDKSATMLTNCLIWRKQFDCEKLANENFSSDNFKPRLGYLHGRDRHGNPVMYNVYKLLDPKDCFEPFGGAETFIRWRIRLMEECVALMDFEQISKTTQLHDYEGVSMLALDSETKKASKYLIQYFQDYYPEMLHAKFFINMPWFFEKAYSVFKSFIAVETRKKFHLCAKNYRAELFDVVCPSQVPPGYGGFNPFVADGENEQQIDNGLLLPRDFRLVIAKLPMECEHIPAGTKKKIQIPCTEHNCIALWEIVTSENDIGIELIDETLANASDDQTAGRLLPMTRVERHTGFEKCTTNAYLVFDNSYSLWTAKKIYYRVTACSEKNDTDTNTDTDTDDKRNSQNLDKTSDLNTDHQNKSESEENCDHASKSENSTSIVVEETTES